MSSHKPRSSRSLWDRIRRAVGSNRRRSGQAPARRKLGLESLESRALLSVSIAPSISGVVYQDLSGTGGALTSNDPHLAGVTVNLFRDNGSGVFSSSDTQLSSTTSDSNGNYTFTNLAAGTYWVQEMGVSNLVQASGQSVDKVVITSADMSGEAGTMIDSFDTTSQYVSASYHTVKTGTSSSAAPEAIGGNRNLYVQLTTPTGAVSLGANSDIPGMLDFSANAVSNGVFWVNWDGDNSNPAVLNPTGLGAIDLTSQGSSTGLELTLGADHDNGFAMVKIYTDASDWSWASVSIPDTTDGSLGSSVFVPWTSFTAGGGSGATFSQVGAVQLSINGVNAIDGQVGPIQAVGPTILDANFANIAEADLAIVKSATPSPATAGGQLTYTLTTTDNGPSNATGVTVSDPLPAGVTYVSSTTSQGTVSFANGVLTDALGNLADGASATTTITVTVNGSDTGTITNTATVTGDQPDPNPNNNTSTVGTPVNAAVDVALTKVGAPNPVKAGATATYTLTATNNGPSNATGVTIVDTLPAGESYVSAGGAGTATSANGQVTISLGNLADGASATSTITVGIASTAVGLITNTAVVSESQTDTNPSNNTATYTLTVDPVVQAQSFPDLKITKVGTPNPVNSGTKLTYTMVVSNNSLTTATGTTVSDPLPAGETFVSVTSTVGTALDSNGTVLVSLGTMVPQATATITVVVNVTAPAGSVLTNTATVTENETDANPADNVATAVTNVINQPSKFYLLAR